MSDTVNLSSVWGLDCEQMRSILALSCSTLPHYVSLFLVGS